MPIPSAADRTNLPPLRLWPGVAILLVQFAARFGVPILVPDWTAFAVIGGVAGWLALVIWWLFFSRGTRAERYGAVVVMVGTMALTWPLLDVSMATGANGAIFPLLAVPGVSLALVLWAMASRHFSAGMRWATLVTAMVLASGFWTLVRTGGFTGSFENDLAWRWTATAEERLLAADTQPTEIPASVAPQPAAPVSANPGEATASASAPAAPVTAPIPAVPGETPAAAAAPAPVIEVPAVPALEWPGFRGRDRNSVIRGVRINPDWSQTPPTELWRRPVGPGWSSFAVHGDLLYTQEQRGDDEIVAAYRVSTGAPVWRHRDSARFYESNGGPGPRGTPTFSNGRVYTFGATGILNALDAATGRVIWSRNVSADSKTIVPDWGFAASPVLVDDLVIVAAAGKLMAYDVAAGAPRWSGPDGGPGYSSPHVLTIRGVPQILLLNGGGVTSVAPADGRKLWEMTVTTSGMSAPIVQPGLTPDGDVLVSDGTASGMTRVAVAQGPNGWTAEPRWTSTGLKPLFNDFVVHKGHAFGFDGSILACIDLADGTRKWKGGRYGSGQLVLLEEQDLLLVVSEEGELALVSAATDKYTQVARVPAIEGKTWNHPVLVGDVLLVRNGEEMAAFRLARVP
jgi:outer membrane protein assembly factor BamB